MRKNSRWCYDLIGLDRFACFANIGLKSNASIGWSLNQQPDHYGPVLLAEIGLGSTASIQLDFILTIGPVLVRLFCRYWANNGCQHLLVFKLTTGPVLTPLFCRYWPSIDCQHTVGLYIDNRASIGSFFLPILSQYRLPAYSWTLWWQLGQYWFVRFAGIGPITAASIG